MKLLLIGGTGCISCEIAALAVQREDMELTLLNRGKRTGFIPPGAACIQADITKTDQVEQVIDGMHFDVVADFLSYTPEQMTRTLNTFKGRFDHYIFISSAAVYRIKTPGEIITEDKSMAGNTLWSYARNKILCERRLEAERRQSGLHYTIVRPAFTYNVLRILYPVGPAHQRFSWTIADRMLKGKPLPMHDDGNALCTVTAASDFAKGFLGLCGNAKAYGEAYHIASDEYLTWNRIARLIGDALGVRPDLCHIPAHDLGFELGADFGEKLIHFSENHMLDSSKIRALVPDFVCTTPFAQGIRRCIEFYREHPEYQIIDPEFDKKMDDLAVKYG